MESQRREKRKKKKNNQTHPSLRAVISKKTEKIRDAIVRGGSESDCSSGHPLARWGVLGLVFVQVGTKRTKATNDQQPGGIKNKKTGGKKPRVKERSWIRRNTKRRKKRSRKRKENRNSDTGRKGYKSYKGSSCTQEAGLGKHLHRRVKNLTAVRDSAREMMIGYL